MAAARVYAQQSAHAAPAAPVSVRSYFPHREPEPKVPRLQSSDIWRPMETLILHVLTERCLLVYAVWFGW